MQRRNHGKRETGHANRDLTNCHAEISFAQLTLQRVAAYLFMDSEHKRRPWTARR
jgi:hypothetical protein